MRILLAIDDSEFADSAIQAVIARGRCQDVEVRVLQVVKPPSLSGLGNMGGYDPTLAEDWDEEIAQAHVLVAKTAAALRSHGLQVSTSVEQGDTESAIINASDRWHADLIVLGAHQRKGLGRLWMGEAASIAQHARCSVEIVRAQPDGAEEPASTRGRP
jgi:nucleotide-binding universal stress UspA family protein